MAINIYFSSSSYGSWDNSATINISNTGLNTYYLYRTISSSSGTFTVKKDGIVQYTRTFTANSGKVLDSLNGFNNGQAITSGSITVSATCKDAPVSKWHILAYKSDGSGVTKKIGDYSTDSVYAPACPTEWKREHYTFSHWTDVGGNTYTPGSTKVSKPSSGTSVYLYANWKPESMKVTFKSASTSQGTIDPMGPKYYDYGTTVNATSYPSEHYITDHWNISWWGDVPSVGDDHLEFTAKGTGVVTVYFQKKKYQLSVYADPAGGGTVSGGGTYEYNSYATITAKANLGYKFGGWMEGGTSPSKSVRITGPLSYTATFTPKNYRVKLNVNGGKWGEDKPESTFISGDNIKVFNEVNTLISQTPTRFGYKFVGWGWKRQSTDTEFVYVYNAGGGFDDRPYIALGGLATEITLYAKWEPIKNYVRFHYYLGDEESDKEKTETEFYTIETTNPYRKYAPKQVRPGDNSTFLGWSTTKPTNWGEASKEGHGNYPIPSQIPVSYVLPYEINISNVKTWDGNTIDVYGFWTVTGKYINIKGSWKKINTAYVKTDWGWRVITDMWVKTGDSEKDWKHEVII